MNKHLVKLFPFLIFFSQSRAQRSARKEAAFAERKAGSKAPPPRRARNAATAHPRRRRPVPAGSSRSCGQGAAPLGGTVVPDRQRRAGAAAARPGWR